LSTQSLTLCGNSRMLHKGRKMKEDVRSFRVEEGEERLLGLHGFDDSLERAIIPSNTEPELVYA
jgi:hypothetical protein